MSDATTPRTPADGVHDAGFEPKAMPGPVIEIADDEGGKPRKRTVAEIQADNERTRAEMSRTVDELADRVDPRVQVAAATQRASEAASEVAEVARAKAAVAQEAAGEFVQDVKRREPRALAILGGAVAALAAVIAISARKK